jgi:predicted 3-demethylubiquinone-9 3-methyltransferase (glyoxalase superfamily)
VQNLTTFLMFDGQAEAALEFYARAFDGGRIVSLSRYTEDGPGTPGTVERAVLSIGGQELLAMDSPVKHDFTFTPSMSLFVDCDTEAGVDELFRMLAEGGDVLMPVDAYPFSKRFAWIKDKFGVSWQLNHA